MTKIITGAWRNDDHGAMQVISGPVGRESVHFQAPTADQVDSEMSQFLEWFNTNADGDPVLVRHDPPIRRWEWAYRARHYRYVAGAVRTQHSALL